MGVPFDITDQAVLTDLIHRPITTQFEDQPRLGDLIAPVKSIPGRVAKIRTMQTQAFGLGQFKSPDGSPALYTPSSSWSESIIELALLEEMHRISGEDWMKLNSRDENVRRAAGVEIVDRGKVLQLRNERLTEWMRWQAFTGELTLTYPTGSQAYINYGFTSAQKPTVSTAWSNVSSADPITDMRSWSTTIASLSGYYGVRYHMSSDTFDYIVRNTNVRNLLTATDRALLVPTKADILSLLRDGTDIVIYDNGYRDDTVGTSRGVPDSLTRFLPLGKVLVTTEYQIEGQNIAETLDGQVLINGGYNEAVIANGPQSEVMYDQMSKNHFFRVASARVPRIVYPECFLYATVI